MRFHFAQPIAAATLVLLLTGGCQRHEPPPPTEVVIVPTDRTLTDPADPAWQAAPEYAAALIPQDMVEPRQLAPTTAQVLVRAATDGKEVAFRLQWADATKDDSAAPAEFTDACAVQVPARIDPSVPAPQMGEPGRGVEIAYWSARAQASVDGRGDSIKDLYPNATVDHYPFESAALKDDPAAKKAMTLRYAPAKAMGNPMSGPRTSPVQDLIAQGPGTLSPASQSTSTGRGVRAADGWCVVIVRRLPAGLGGQTRSQVALAVWDGNHDEVGARKMRTGWIPLTLQAKP